MTWIQTYIGERFYPLEPRVEDINIIDIAHSLSLICRFNGHCKFFYSVAQHSVLLSRLVRNYKRYALLHDAAEAYFADVSMPVKSALFDLQIIEKRIMDCIKLRFKFRQSASMKHAELRLLATEKAWVMHDSLYEWSSLKNIKPFSLCITHGWGPEEAEFVFLEEYKKLFGVEV